MTISLTINGSTYFYPQDGDIAWGPEATDWAAAVTTGMLQKAGGLFQLLSEVDFGITYGLKANYLKSRTADIASAGVLRLAKTDNVSWRNNANSADLDLTINASDELTFNGVPLGRLYTVSDTNSVDLSLLAGDLSANVKLSSSAASSGYQLVELSINSDGIFAQSSQTFSALTLTGASGVIIGSAGVLSSESALSPTRGGTGVSNAGTLTYGSNNITFTTGGATSLTLPTSGTLITASSTDTLTNKSMSGSSNTFTNIGISSLATVLGDANKAIVRDASGVIVSALIVNANVDASAAIARTKLANGTASHVLINDASGIMSSEAQLASTRGGTGVNNAGAFTYGSNNLTFTTSGATTLTLPTSGTLITASSTDTLTNKTMSGSSNTFSNIGISSLATVLSDANKAIVRDASGVVVSALLVNANVDASAAIARTKLANGSASHVLINDGSGVMSSEAQLASTRGGTGVNNAGTLTYGSNNVTLTTAGVTSLTLPTTGTVATLAGSETLSNKTMGSSNTLTGATMASLTNGGTVTIPSGSDTLVARTSTDTLTNKTLTSPIIGTQASLANQAIVKFYEQTGNGTNFIGLSAPDSVTADLTLKLPNGDGSNGQFITTDGMGNLSWGNASGLVNPMTNLGDMIYGGVAGAATRLAVGTANQVLQSNGAGAPTWVQIANANVSSSAAIAYSKLNLATSIVNADVSASAAIDGSKIVSASGSVAGVVNTTTQSFAGDKTFNNALSVTGTTTVGTTGIAFSTGGTTLAGYKEASFTPTISFAGGTTGITYGAQLGRYVRVGKLVNLQAAILLSSKGSSTGILRINLPYTVSTGVTGGSTILGGGFVTWTSVNAAGNSWGPLTFANEGNSYITLGIVVSGAFSDTTDATLTNTSFLAINITYQTTATF